MSPSAFVSGAACSTVQAYFVETSTPHHCCVRGATWWFLGEFCVFRQAESLREMAQACQEDGCSVEAVEELLSQLKAKKKELEVRLHRYIGTDNATVWSHIVFSCQLALRRRWASYTSQ